MTETTRVVLASVRNDAHRSIEDTLKLVGRLLRDTEQKTAAVDAVKPGFTTRVDGPS